MMENNYFLKKLTSKHTEEKERCACNYTIARNERCACNYTIARNEEFQFV